MATEYDKDKVLERVRKMMALANDSAASEGERNNAMRMAHATLAKYNLSMAEADAAGGKQEARGPSTMETRSRPWIRQCAQSVAHLFFCEYFFVKTGANTMKSYFVGKESNVITAIEITQHVIKSIQKEGNASMKAGGFDLAWKVSFSKGATASIRIRCRELRAEAERDNAPASTGTSLVLANVYALEQTANDSYIKDTMGISLKVRASRETVAGDGYHAGRDHGNTVGLHRQVGGGSKTKQERLR